MKICKIYIGDYKQFKRLELDFTHPETGKPLDKICFIGRNGTGKSNLLELIRNTLISNLSDFPFQIILKIFFENEELLLFKNPFKHGVFLLKAGSVDEKDFVVRYFDYRNNSNTEIEDTQRVALFRMYLNDLENKKQGYFDWASMQKFVDWFYANKKNDKLLVNVFPESFSKSYSQINRVPSSTLNSALELFNGLPAVHHIAADYVGEFWKQLNYLIKKRENDRNEFEDRPENQNKTKSQLRVEFDSQNAEILFKLAILWNKILDSAGLEFDYKNARNPVQLNDNLEAYIINKKTGEQIQYSQLSTGIRNFIFKIGHIYSLYFNRKIDQGFLLVDEPENSLFPDFLYDLIDIYKEITTDKDGNNNTQMFFATHSPIIAAQFEPYERVILEWNDEGTISAHRGVAPVGDDPNDVLKKDFEIRSLMTQKGLEAWDEYLKLKKEIRTIQDEPKKKELMEKLMQIGTAYNFH